MKSRFATLTILALSSALIASPAHLHGGQAAPAQHDHGAAPDASKAAPAEKADMMAAMKASDAKLDDLVKKMNEAKGSAKTDAIADVVNALVQEHKAMMSDPAMMNHMMSMMDMMGKK